MIKAGKGAAHKGTGGVHVFRASSSKERWSFNLEALTSHFGFEKCLHSLMPSCNSIHEFQIMHRKALLKMLSPTFLRGSAHVESLTWVFTISDVTEMSVGPGTTGGLGAGEGHDQICWSHLESGALGALSKGSMNPGPEFNSSSTLQFFDLLRLFIMGDRTFEKKLTRFEPRPRGQRTQWRSNGKEFGLVCLVHCDILSVHSGCLAHRAGWK